MMKIDDLKRHGTYAAVTFSPKTVQQIADYIKAANIPNPVNLTTLHTTLLYSRTECPNYEPVKSHSMRGTVTKLVKWPSHPTASGKVSMCLILLYDCPELVARHHQLMDEHDATYDYPSFKCHITLSYNVGSVKVDALPPITQYITEVEIVGEYKSDLDLDFARTPK